MGIKEWFIKIAVQRAVKKMKGSPMIEKLKGKRSYIVAALALIGALLEMFGVNIPAYVWPILGGLGLGAVRAGIKDIKDGK